MSLHETFEGYATARLPTLLRAARVICGDATLAEDLVQEVLIKLHARWDVVAVVDEPDAYVRRMLVNEFHSWRRKWARVTPRADLPERGRLPDLAGALAERDELRAAIAQLPDKQRVVIAMRYLLDLPDSEIAAALGCAQSTVRVHGARALKRLRGSVGNATDATDISNDHHPRAVAPGDDALIYVTRI